VPATLAYIANSASGGRHDTGWLVYVFALFTLWGAMAIWYAARGIWAGERARGLKPVDVASVSGGRVILSGYAEPAWAVIASLVGGKPCVWHHVKSNLGQSRIRFFEETNAVPFVLSDGTARILVLARRARWDPGTGAAGWWAGADDAAAVAEGEPSQDALRMATGVLQAPPTPLSYYLARGHVPGDGSSCEETIGIGERVTVVGQAVPYAGARITDKDGCGDFASLNLSSEFCLVQAPHSGLDVLAGKPEDVKLRARLHVIFAVLGVAAVCVGIIGLAYCLQASFG
jgi:hypothetical protein